MKIQFEVKEASNFLLDLKQKKRRRYYERDGTYKSLYIQACDFVGYYAIYVNLSRMVVIYRPATGSILSTIGR